MPDAERFRKPPFEFKVSRRQWIFAVGEVARQSLSEKYGLEPSSDLIRGFIQENIFNFVYQKSLFKRAWLYIGKEIDVALEEAAREGGTVASIRKNAEVEVRRKYQDIENDSSKNYSYLDEIL